MGRARLTFGHGASDSFEEAFWVAAHSIRCSFDTLEAALSDRMTADQRNRAEATLAARVETRRPLAYLLGEAWLAGRRFYVDERVIVPRSFIAELLPRSLRPWLPRPVRSVLDLCTGSACLAILLAGRFQRAKIDAADISRAALEVAEINIGKHRLARRVELVRSDLFSQLRGRRYDIIVSNPPYVSRASMHRLPPEYRFEPELALAGGKDGLDVMRRILLRSPAHLQPGGILICEIGHNRHALERAYPRLPFVWLTTSAGSEYVFLLMREDILKENARRSQRV